MTTVFIVEEGEYSDRHVVAVFSQRSLAERFVKANEDDYHIFTITEFPIDPSNWVEALTSIPDGTTWMVEMRRDGTTVRVERRTCWFPNILGIPYLRRDGVLEMFVLARSEEHAVKIANEKRAQLIALGKWKKGGTDETFIHG